VSKIRRGVQGKVLKHRSMSRYALLTTFSPLSGCIGHHYTHATHQDDLGSMSESARIAYLYRSSATASVSVLDCLQSTQALVITDNDSCSPQCTNMCPKDEHTVPPQALQVASRIHDMVSSFVIYNRI